MLRPLTLLVAALLALPAAAHKASDAYLQLNTTDSGLGLRLDIALRDLDVALDLDANADGRLTWGEIKAAWPAIEDYALGGVQVAACPLRPVGQGLERRADGAYAVLWLASDCRPNTEPAIRYTLMRDVDPTHRGLAKIELPGQPARVRVLDPTRAAVLAAPAPVAVVGREPLVAPAAGATGAPPAAPTPPAATAFLSEGLHHILTGYDHVLFLLCLLLPSVMRRTPHGWQPVPRLWQAVLPVAGIVTAFTVAHSITLALAALGLVSLPPGFIEPAIAVTIVLAAFDNLRPIFHGRRVPVTFAFGLIHGFGFAGVLAELDLPAPQFAWALLQFNLGLELGQLTIVLVAAGGLYLLRQHRRYPSWVIRGGSVAALVAGMLWFIERTAEVSLLPL